MKLVDDGRPRDDAGARDAAGHAGASAAERALLALARRTLGAGDDATTRRATPWELRLPSGSRTRFGNGDPAFTLTVRDARGLAALRSLDELRVCEAYMDEHLDLDGDLRAAVALRTHLGDTSTWIAIWRRLEPLLIGRRRARRRWVRHHYDADDVQLAFLDDAHRAYTPGVFAHDDEPLEAATERKLALAFAATKLARGMRALDVGCGWGPFVRYAGRRGVHVTGLTLARRQLAWVQREVIDAESLPARVLLEDFFAHRPDERYDAIVVCGAIEELADYPRVLDRLASWLVPGGRAYLDFMSARADGVMPAFVTRHVFPGTTSRVHLPKLVAAVTASPLQLVELHDDRRNYMLTSRHWFERFERRAEEIRARHGERLFRLFRLYLAANPVMLSDPSYFAGAYRVVLELPADSAYATSRAALA